jgi:carbon-monoxide dehydrogenase large subunit
MKGRVIGDAGAYPAIGAFLVYFTRQMAPGVYDIPKVDVKCFGVATNTTPMASYRGAGRPEATQFIERALDVAADQLGIDPVEIRRRNFLKPEAFPLTTVTGSNYDSGDYDRPLTEACRIADYDGLRAEQAARRARGDAKFLGIGVSTYVEITAPGIFSEYGKVEVAADGFVDVTVGTSSHGQGHRTAFAMIIQDVLGVPMEKVRLIQSDTDVVPRGSGTMGSRSVQIAGSAVLEAGTQVLEKAKRLAAHLLEADPDDITVFEGVGLGVAGVPANAITCRLGRAPRSRARLQPGGVHLPVRRAPRRGRDRHRHRPGRAAAHDRGRRLRAHHQPGARARAAARRHRAGGGPGALRAGRLRRRRQPAHRQPHGLRDAERGRVPQLRDGQHRDPDAA